MLFCLLEFSSSLIIYELNSKLLSYKWRFQYSEVNCNKLHGCNEIRFWLLGFRGRWIAKSKSKWKFQCNTVGEIAKTVFLG